MKLYLVVLLVVCAILAGCVQEVGEGGNDNVFNPKGDTGANFGSLEIIEVDDSLTITLDLFFVGDSVSKVEVWIFDCNKWEVNRYREYDFNDEEFAEVGRNHWRAQLKHHEALWTELEVRWYGVGSEGKYECRSFGAVNAAVGGDDYLDWVDAEMLICP